MCRQFSDLLSHHRLIPMPLAAFTQMLNRIMFSPRFFLIRFGILDSDFSQTSKSFLGERTQKSITCWLLAGSVVCCQWLRPLGKKCPAPGPVKLWIHWECVMSCVDSLALCSTRTHESLRSDAIFRAYWIEIHRNVIRPPVTRVAMTIIFVWVLMG